MGIDFLGNFLADLGLVIGFKISILGPTLPLFSKI